MLNFTLVASEYGVTKGTALSLSHPPPPPPLSHFMYSPVLFHPSLGRMQCFCKKVAQRRVVTMESIPQLLHTVNKPHCCSGQSWQSHTNTHSSTCVRYFCRSSPLFDTRSWQLLEVVQTVEHVQGRCNPESGLWPTRFLGWPTLRRIS